MIQELTEKNFDENIKNGIKFIAFTADWCGYCQRQKPILQELSDENIWIGEVNPDKDPILAQRYSIQAFPSFLLFKEGKLLAQFAGYRPKYELLNTILGYLKQN